MKTIKRFKNWVIKEMEPGETSIDINDNNKYMIWTKNHILVKNHLSLEEAIKFCKETDYNKWNNFGVQM